ncbi:MAG: gas vesicle protein GvpO, partial [Pseudonocardiaceae bacterium]
MPQDRPLPDRPLQDRPRARAEPSARSHVESAPERSRPRADPGGVSAAEAARCAARQVAEFTGRDPETVVAIERTDRGWQIGVEVVESRRIP